MKAIIYWPLVVLLFLAEAYAVVSLFLLGAEGYEAAGTIHRFVAFLFGILIGIHRRSVSVALLGVLLIGTTPLLGIVSMIIIDDKFNRETRHEYFESSENLRIGNPFSTNQGEVEVADNSRMTGEDFVPVVKRVMREECEVSEREVEVISSMRSLSVFPLLERIAASSSGEGRVLAQAAISEMTERASIWAANLHRLEVRNSEVPASIIRLVVRSYLNIRKLGRSPQAFGLPDSSELKVLLRKRLKANRADVETLTSLCELLILEDELEEAEELVEAHRNVRGFHYQLEMAKILSARGDWLGLLKRIPNLDRGNWSALSQQVRLFWGAST